MVSRTRAKRTAARPSKSRNAAQRRPSAKKKKSEKSREIPTREIAPHEIVPHEIPTREFFNAVRRTIDYFSRSDSRCKSTELLIALVALVEGDNATATYTKGQRYLAKRAGLTKRTVERFLTQWATKRLIARRPKLEHGASGNHWAGGGYDVVWQAPFVTPVAKDAPAAAPRTSIQGSGGSSSSSTPHARGISIPGSTSSSKASSAELRAVLELAAIQSGSDRGKLLAENATPALAYTRVAVAYARQIKHRHPHGIVNLNTEPLERVAVGDQVLLLAKKYSASVDRVAELLVASYLADTNPRKEKELHPLPWIARELGPRVGDVAGDLHQAAKLRAELAAQRDETPTPDEDDAGGFDFDALGFPKLALAGAA